MIVRGFSRKSEPFSSLFSRSEIVFENFRAKIAIDFQQLGYKAFELIGGCNIGFGGNREMTILPSVTWHLTMKLTGFGSQWLFCTYA